MKVSTKKRVYVDMDGVLCNFYKAARQALTNNPKQKYPQSQWGFFLKLEEIPGAIEGFRKLEEKYDMWILTRPSFRNVNCYTEKAQWIWDHLGFDIVEKTIMAPNKSFLKGDYLIDDQNNAGQEEFEGEWIRFKTDKFPDWESVVEYLMKESACENIGCIDGYIECENCSGTNLDENDEVCDVDDCFDGLVECECNLNNKLNR